MIMKSKMTVNCRNPRMPITTFSYRENLMRPGALVAGLSMEFLHRESDPKALERAYGILGSSGMFFERWSWAKYASRKHWASRTPASPGPSDRVGAEEPATPSAAS